MLFCINSTLPFDEATFKNLMELIESINKFKVTEYDFSSKKIPDSFILKINKWKHL